MEACEFLQMFVIYLGNFGVIIHINIELLFIAYLIYISDQITHLCVTNTTKRGDMSIFAVPISYLITRKSFDG